MTLVGGLGTLSGPLVGSAVVVLLENKIGELGNLLARITTIDWFNTLGESVTMVTGLIFVICVLAFRQGIMGEIIAFIDRRRARRLSGAAQRAGTAGALSSHWCGSAVAAVPSRVPAVAGSVTVDGHGRAHGRSVHAWRRRSSDRVPRRVRGERRGRPRGWRQSPSVQRSAAAVFGSSGAGAYGIARALGCQPPERHAWRGRPRPSGPAPRRSRRAAAAAVS